MKSIISSFIVSTIFLLGVDNVEARDVCFADNLGDISGSVNLNASCIYKQSITISKSNTLLNCNGAEINGEGEIPIGISINGHGRALDNVVVKNCKVVNFKNNGIKISSGIPIYQLNDSRKVNYDSSPSNIIISNSIIVNSGRVGVYFDSYVHNSKLLNSVIQGSGMSGVYFEQATRNNEIIGSKILNNGYGGKGDGREGVAIDSSANNLIERSVFAGNSAGGVFLYKNCGEKYSTGKSVIRWQHSDNNIIKNNSFYNEKVAVWIASRQSRNLSKWDCGDESMDGSNKYYRDFANNNLVVNNIFCGYKVGVKIEGDGNNVSNNVFENENKNNVIIPLTMRGKLLGDPPISNNVNNNTVNNNTVSRCDSISLN